MNLNNAAAEIGISVEAYKRLCSLFIENTDNDIVKLKEACDANRLQDAADIAHHIKGAASNMDFLQLADTAKQLQLKALNSLNDTPALRESYEELVALYGSIKTEIEAQLWIKFL